MYQDLELRMSAQIEQQTRQINELTAAIRAPISGAASATGESVGLYHDGWIAPEATFFAKPKEPLSKLIVRGYIPERNVATKTHINIAIDGKVAIVSSFDHGAFSMELDIEPKTDVTRIDIKTGRTPDLRDDSNGDARALGFVLSDVQFIAVPPVEPVIADTPRPARILSRLRRALS
jgi:hypothetical protein